MPGTNLIDRIMNNSLSTFKNEIFISNRIYWLYESQIKHMNITINCKSIIQWIIINLLEYVLKTKIYIS